MTLALVELELWFMYMTDTSSEESSIQLQRMYIVAAGRRPVVVWLPRGDIKFFFVLARWPVSFSFSLFGLNVKQIM